MRLCGGITSTVLVGLLLGAGTAFGIPVFGEPADFTGSRTENLGQIVTGGTYATDGLDLTISWTVTPNGPNFNYEYIISGYTTPGISHFLLTLSPGCALDAGCITGIENFYYGTFGNEGNSAPGIPGEVDGVKFDFGDENTTTYSFTSNRAPVWGDFYFKGGDGPYAYNAGFGNLASENPLEFIARPDTSGGVPPAEIPEPGTWALLAGGIVFLALGRKTLSC